MHSNLEMPNTIALHFLS